MKNLWLIAVLFLFSCATHPIRCSPDLTKIRFMCGEKALICAEIYQIYSDRMAMVAIGPSVGRILHHAQAYTLINGKIRWISLKHGYIKFWMQEEFRPTEFHTVPQFKHILKVIGERARKFHEGKN